MENRYLPAIRTTSLEENVASHLYELTFAQVTKDVNDPQRQLY